MAGSMSDFLELEVLDHVLGGGNYTRPTNVDIALFTAAPTDSGGGTEVAAMDYERLEIVNDATNWPAASSGAKANGTDFEFPEAENNWGTIVAMAIFDADTSGNMLFWADLASSRVVNDGD